MNPTPDGIKADFANGQNFNRPPFAPIIENHIVLAVLTTIFCCMPFGIISLIYSIQVFISQNSGNIAMAQMSADKALYWGKLALWCGLAIYGFNCLFFGLPLLITALYNAIYL